ncbi:hypothetical protein ACFPRL_25355 [Pseudoclavibacter helvolus]
MACGIRRLPRAANRAPRGCRCCVLPTRSKRGTAPPAGHRRCRLGKR